MPSKPVSEVGNTYLIVEGDGKGTAGPAVGIKKGGFGREWLDISLPSGQIVRKRRSDLRDEGQLLEQRAGTSS